MFSSQLKNNTIIVAKRNIISTLIEKVREEYFLNLKFFDLDSLRKKCTFTYDHKTIYYLIDKYKYNYDVAIKILNNLYYVSDKYYNDKKLDDLVNLKKELYNNKLLHHNPLFNYSLKKYNIIIYNYYTFTKYDLKFINWLKSITSVDIINDTKSTVSNNTIFEFDNLEEEVTFLAEDISKKIHIGTNINNIKICGINDEYKTFIKRIFKFYNLPIIFNDNKLYGTKISNLFFKYLDDDINNTVEKLKKKINLKNKSTLDIYNTIINIVNKFAWCNSYLDIKDLLINEFKNTLINKKEYKNKISIIPDLKNTSEKDYIYLIGFNQGSIPKTYRDEDYLNDNEKKILEIDTSDDMNIYTLNKWIFDISHTNNLTITYKKNSYSGEFYLSSLNDYLNYKIEPKKIAYSNYSNILNRILLAKKIDNLIKYNEHDKYLDILYNNYPNINYLTYDNKYTGIDPKTLKKYLKDKLTLSYSAINNYYHCAFKYYIANILKIDKYENTFQTIIGKLFHHILEICFNTNIDIKKEYYDYISKQKYIFNAKEKFFLDNLLKELEFIINTIKEQNEYNNLNKCLYEDEIVIDKSRLNYDIIFKGYVDKILMDDKEEVGAIIDYKTGGVNINLNNIIYGLDLQLPVYIYLTKNKFPNIRIIGFYLQKILNSSISISKEQTYEELKKDKLKLIGYTSMYEEDINILDSNYSNSKVIKGMRTSSKGIASKKIYNDDLINNIYNLVDDKINKAIENITKGSFNINPKVIGMDNIGCQYCNYKDICFMKNNDLIYLNEYKNMEFFEEK